jgi:NADPH-dependent 2,4-dienoyl-CoA reductase/sulfur reductase-like enzyme
MSAAVNPVIVGAGPAGLRAAQALVAGGLRPVLIDESPKPGGQIYRQTPDGMSRSHKALYGFERDKARAVHAILGTLAGHVDYRPETMAWNVEGQTLYVHAHGRVGAVPFSHLILATGATDRVLPFPGWLLPGVYTLGGAQVALKYQGCAIGRRVVFAGTGPLLYLVAYQYAKAGARVLAVLDTATTADQVRAVPGLARIPGLLGKGLWYAGWLRLHGVPVQTGVRLGQARGDGRVEAFSWERRAGDARSVRDVDCDAVAFGYALRSETQLASLLGCEFGFDDRDRAWLPVRDDMGRTSRTGVYVAGDGRGIAGADAAEISGEQAALALLADLGRATDATRLRALSARSRRLDKTRRALERAFPFPGDWGARADDDLVVCRCEEITAGQIRRAVREDGACEMNRVKALTRVGMGRCQSRMCGLAAAEIVASAAGLDVREVGRVRSQPPVKPLVIGAFEPGQGDGEQA